MCNGQRVNSSINVHRGSIDKINMSVFQNTQGQGWKWNYAKENEKITFYS